MKAEDTVKRNKYYHCLEYDHDQEGDICLIACGMERCDPGANYGPELRDCYHLHAVLSGTGVLKAGGKEFRPRFGQLFLLKDGETVQYTADEQDPWRYCWVTYSGTEAAKISGEIGFTEGVYCIDTSADVHEFYELIYRMHEKPEMNYINDMRRRGILLEFLALAMETTTAGKQKAAIRREYSTEFYVQKAIRFIDLNYQTIKVSDVVEYIGFSRSYFTTIFRKYAGISPQEYLIQCRLKNACRLLSETDIPIQMVADEVGYEDPLVFTKSFSKKYKMSPREYRKRSSEKA